MASTTLWDPNFVIPLPFQWYFSPLYNRNFIIPIPSQSHLSQWYKNNSVLLIPSLFISMAFLTILWPLKLCDTQLLTARKLRCILRQTNALWYFQLERHQNPSVALHATACFTCYVADDYLSLMARIPLSWSKLPRTRALLKMVARWSQ